jgi:tetratricopeptide (TPR) repeat protein
MWESFYIDGEGAFFDPVPSVLYANIPVLICIGENDEAMPMTSAVKVYERLKQMGMNVTFKKIEKEVHQYNKYDVFPVMDAWLSSNFQSVEFTLQPSDSLLIRKYAAANELELEIGKVPYEGGHAEQIMKCYRKAAAEQTKDESTWFKLGIKLFANDLYNESFESFKRASGEDFALQFASLVWMGHLKDLKGQREESVALYRKALDVYPGFPMRHDNWKIVIDKDYIEARMKEPFRGIVNKN